MIDSRIVDRPCLRTLVLPYLNSVDFRTVDRPCSRMAHSTIVVYPSSCLAVDMERCTAGGYILGHTEKHRTLCPLEHMVARMKKRMSSGNRQTQICMEAGSPVKSSMTVAACTVERTASCAVGRMTVEDKVARNEGYMMVGIAVGKAVHFPERTTEEDKVERNEGYTTVGIAAGRVARFPACTTVEVACNEARTPVGTAAGKVVCFLECTTEEGTFACVVEDKTVARIVARSPTHL